MSKKADKETKITSQSKEYFLKSENEEFVDVGGRDIMNQKEHPFNEVCSVCQSQITNKKYICIICQDCVLCPKCEEIHIHPVLKCKSSQLSTLKDVFVYMNKRNMVIQNYLKNEKDSSVFGLINIFSGKYEIKLSTSCNKITMRPNKSLNIPITLQNLSATKIECGPLQLFLIAKNTKDLKIYNKELTLVINKREQNDVNILVESNNHCGEYNFMIELYSVKNIKLKSNPLEFNLIVNEDEEEEELNELFKDYPSIILNSKETKIGIKKIRENESIKEDPITILQFLKNNNNDVQKTIENLSSRSQINRNVL